MARCLLVTYAGYPYSPSSLLPDNGLAGLAACLQAEGHDVLVCDLMTVETMRRLFPRRTGRPLERAFRAVLLEGHKPGPMTKAKIALAQWRLARHQARTAAAMADEVAALARSYRADLVGFKLWNGDGFSGAIRMAEVVRRERPGVRVVAGGPHVDWFGERIHSVTDAFDALVAGDGEGPLVQLAAWADGRIPLETIPGVLCPGRPAAAGAEEAVRCQDLDALPAPLYDQAVYPAMADDDKIRMLVLEESRGCPFRCNFCIHPAKSGGRWRVKSAARVADEMQALASRFDNRLYCYGGSNTPREAMVGIARELLDRDFACDYACFGHANVVRRAEMDLLARSGCRVIFYGAESGNQRLLDEVVNKSVRAEDLETAVRRTKLAGICALTSVIHPMPGETPETARETLAMIRRMRPDAVPITMPGLIPGSTWASEPSRFGFTFDEPAEAAFRKGMLYKIKLLLPPTHWDPLPYRIDDKPFAQVARENAAFTAAIEQDGIPTGVGYDVALMAFRLGTDIRRFRDETRLAVLTGNWEAMAETAKRLNRSAPREGRAEPARDAVLVTSPT